MGTQSGRGDASRPVFGPLKESPIFSFAYHSAIKRIEVRMVECLGEAVIFVPFIGCAFLNCR